MLRSTKDEIAELQKLISSIHGMIRDLDTAIRSNIRTLENLGGRLRVLEESHRKNLRFGKII